MAHLACFRPSILRLPPDVRSSIAIYVRSRAFSATAQRKVSLVDVALTPPNVLLDTFHSIGLPWAIAIPATAIFVRGIFVYRLLTLPARKRQRMRNVLMPLTFARAQAAISQENIQKSKQDLKSMADAGKAGEGRRRLKHALTLHAVGKKFGAPLFTPTGIYNFGILIIFTEAIRLKCSSRHGLLSAVLYSFQWLAHKLLPNVFSTPPGALPPPDTAPEMQHTLNPEHISDSAREGNIRGSDVDINTTTQPDHFDIPIPDDHALAQTNQLQPLVETSNESFNAYFDPSMMREGLPWIQDLTIPDPTLTLPIAVSATLIIPTLLEARSRQQLSPNGLQPQGSLFGLTRLQRIRITIGFLFAFICTNIPSGILLYFVCSMTVSALQQRWLDWKYPMYKSILPCTRPTRMKVTKKWDDV